MIIFHRFIDKLGYISSMQNIEFIKMHSIKNNGYEYLIPASDKKNEATIKKILSNENIHEEIKIIVKSGLSREFFLVSDFSIVASGTASLEAAVFGANPIICYKTNFLNYSNNFSRRL